MTTPRVSAAPGAKNERTKGVQARLARVGSASDVVSFQFNPEKITVGHAPDRKAENRSMGKPGESRDGGPIYVGDPNAAIVNAGEATISFDTLTFDGPRVTKDCTRLLEWTYPVPDTNPDPAPAKLPKKGGQLVAPPVPARTSGVTPPTGVGALAPPMVLPLLLFTWDQFDPGTKFLDRASRTRLYVILSKVEVTYSRFDQQGVPYRANVKLTCKIPPVKADGPNPTSGGRPGRRGHLVTAGEDLASIAREKYGHPGYWRDLAALNGVDDPLRVRPGRRLYVPGFAELREGTV